VKQVNPEAAGAEPVPQAAPATPAFDQSLDDRLAALLSAGAAGAAAG
jgi:hypothetical protein